MLGACGGSHPLTTQPVVTNSQVAPTEQLRNDVVKETLAALAAGDVERLMTLADPKGLYEYALSCKPGSGDSTSPTAADRATDLRRDLTKATAEIRGSKLEVVSIRNEARWDEYRMRSRDRNATFIAKGGTLSDACTARADLLFHEVEVRVRLDKDGSSKEIKTKIDMLQAKGRWYVIKVPKDLESSDSAASAAVAKMEGFSTAMCSCKDKACADKVNEDLSKWGTEMAKSAGAARDERPDPDLARKSADIMSRYTECMTKLMMAGSTP